MKALQQYEEVQARLHSMEGVCDTSRAAAVRWGEMWGDMGRYGEIEGDLWRTCATPRAPRR